MRFMPAHSEPLQVTVRPRPDHGDFMAISPQVCLPAHGPTPKAAALELALGWFFGERLGTLFTREEAVGMLELETRVVLRHGAPAVGGIGQAAEEDGDGPSPLREERMMQ